MFAVTLSMLFIAHQCGVWYMGDEKGRQSRTSFMYGAGVQINPIENVAIDIGYEGSSIDDGNKSHTINGFNIAVGYRF